METQGPARTAALAQGAGLAAIVIVFALWLIQTAHWGATALHGKFADRSESAIPTWSVCVRPAASGPTAARQIA